MHAIEIIDLSFTYENRTTPALDHVNLRVKDQESVLLAGASGSGKPTLLKCINRLIPHRYIDQYSEQANLAGKPVAALDLDELSLAVGTVFAVYLRTIHNLLDSYLVCSRRALSRTQFGKR